jgi:acyl transferase domain-containing protein/NAD(P)-dependent dehydrogenase (short-subunit alcohol dehydrogenase family)/acyl carrier protein
MEERTGYEIAVIGMAGVFPGAKNIDEFWNNLKNGIESIAFLTDEELKENDIDPGALPGNYVKCKGGVLEDKEFFDAFFFGYTPHEAVVMTPQSRKLHECTWAALENAGYNPDSYRGLIGYYVGGGDNFYWKSLNLLSGKVNELGDLVSWILIDNDFLATKVSHKLNLKGPAVFVGTACSTSLVAVHMACRALLSGECDIALAGGAAVSPEKKIGYYYSQGLVVSPDGHCRAFDEKAKGSIGGNGCGLVVLKALEDAEQDGDCIHAIIKSTVINNDGTRKVGFTAPSIEGQLEVIRAALRMAEVEPGTITYVETHGTGTELGDPVEIEALKLAFDTDKKGYCAIGSVKTNVGHLDQAAGVTGLIKTVQALKHRLIPPSLHFEKPNPKIDFENSPFYVNTRAREWENGSYPLRAGVSSFGLGGTNAHAVLEEYPARDESHRSSREYQILLLSAKTKSALEKAAENLVNYLKDNPLIDLADAAYTLQVGRKAFQHRRMLTAAAIDEVIENLANPDSRKVQSSRLKEEKPRAVFMFPGLGAQYVGMGLGLYRTEPLFREEMDRCFAILSRLVDYDIKEILYPGLASGVSGVSEASEVSGVSEASGVNEANVASEVNRSNKSYTSNINHIEIAQLAVFIFEYALAKLVMSWGIRPHAMIGYSLGEYTAACISGVFSLEDALKLVAARGRLLEDIPAGAMLSVPLSREELIPFLDNRDTLSLAIDNGPSCVVAGPGETIKRFEKKMKENKCLCTPIKASHAIHSFMMEPLRAKFQEEIKKVKLNKPAIPYISNVTGTWLSVEAAADPGYWDHHLRQTVRFSEGMKLLVTHSHSIFIEIGPGHDLTVLSRHHLEENSPHNAVNLTRHSREKVPDNRYLLNKIGRLWLYGLEIDWQHFYKGEKRYRISLPSYPFEGKSYWIEGNPFQLGARLLKDRPRFERKTDISQWFYLPSWKRSVLPSSNSPKRVISTGDKVCWVVFGNGDQYGMDSQLVKVLAQFTGSTRDVFMVKPGRAFAKVDEGIYTINPGQSRDYHVLFDEFHRLGKVPGTIFHLWGITGLEEDNNDPSPTLEQIDGALDMGFYSLIYLAQAIGKRDIKNRFRVVVVTNNMQNVGSEEVLFPEKATVLGAVKVIPLEYSNIDCCSIDMAFSRSGADKNSNFPGCVLMEMDSGFPDNIVAYRSGFRWLPVYDAVPLEKAPQELPRLRKGGIYLVSGGLGGIGYVLAEHLARQVQAKLVLIGRSPFPAREQWQQWLESHDEEDSTSQKIRKVRALEKMGARVLVCSADAANVEQMQQVRTTVEKQWGTINGVIHAAGLPDGGVIPLRTRENTDPVLVPKIKGTLVLSRLLEDLTLDFFILCSSISSVLAPLGQVGYCGANAFLDAWALRKSYLEKVFTVSIDWDVWKEVGMGVETARLLKENEGIKDSEFLIEHGILNAEGIDVFDRILRQSFPQVIVCTTDFFYRLEQFAAAAGGEPDEIAKVEIFSGTTHPRPELSTEYEPPRTDFEKAFADILKNFFGYEEVGIQDNFFEFGVTSLTMIRIDGLLKEKLKKDIPIVLMFEYPSIHSLGQYLEQEEKRVKGPVEEIEIVEESEQAEELLYDSIDLLREEEDE